MKPLYSYENYDGTPTYLAINKFKRYKRKLDVKQFDKRAKKGEFQHPEGLRRILLKEKLLSNGD